MVFPKITVSTLIACLIFVHGVQSEDFMTQTQANGPQDELIIRSALEQLGSTLTKIYPMEKPLTLNDPETASGYGLRLCWKFFRPDPGAVMKLSQAVASYRGDTRWQISAAPGGQICLAAPPGAAVNSENVPESPVPRQSPSSLALSGVPELCIYLERVLNLQAVEAKRFQYDFRVPPLTEVDDFWDPGTHVIWVVADPSELPMTNHSHSDQVKRLQFSLTLEQWRALYLDLFGWAANKYDSQQDPEGLRAYPALSRLSETESEMFAPSEIRRLRADCLRAYEKARDIETFRALNKLVIACNWAIRLDRGLYFRGP